MAAGGELAIESVPARLWCSQCQEEFEAQEFVFECPKCHECSRELRQGREMELVNMEVS